MEIIKTVKIEVLYAPTFQIFRSPMEEFKTTPVVEVEQLKKMLFDSNIPIKYSQRIIDELEKQVNRGKEHTNHFKEAIKKLKFV